MQQLSGGREGVIYQHGHTVIRPLNSYSTTVHLLLKHLSKQGFQESPKFIAIDGDNEVLSFIAGDTFNYPLTDAIASTEALTSAAALLRKLHDTSADFLALHHHEPLQWMLPSKSPQEIICHGDFTPYNVALKNETVVGVFDFDTAPPAPRIWDVAFSVYCWAPFKTDNNDALGSLSEQILRAKLFCDYYGASQTMRKNLVESMIERLQALLNYMYSQANDGDKQFADNIEDAHHLSYLNDISYLQAHKSAITAGII